MKLVILAAGEGVRMRPLTLTTPKPLIVYRNKPALTHLFEALPATIDEVIMVVKYLGHQIKSHCGDFFHGRKITYVEGDSNGNALGFIKTAPFFSPGERFAVSYADDILTRKEMEDCLAHELSWLCYAAPNPKEVGIVGHDDEGFITSFIEKPENPVSNLTGNGFKVVNTEIFSCPLVLHPVKKEYYVSDLMAAFCKKYSVKAVMGDPNHSQLTSPEDVIRLNIM